ncbi:hypothetical protein DSM104299_01426 [Baekduia alba]|uniref:AAA family ATPase n=1 Tax=Baekduia alba TaxID=2997333 RepID=UPI002340AC76|nr:AAA family ATPase [Baekduia alba]WCB92727.1 hypothetical protein DSM104299_01426 [Baekduia alba]
MTATLVLIGAPGSGKSSVLEALSTRLQIDGVAHGSIESEQLAMGWPLLPGVVWIAQLTAVLAVQREAGRERFLIAATTETAAELAGVVAATGCAASDVLVVCLSAPPDLVAARITAREPDTWPGKPHLITHARQLAETMPSLPGIDLVLSTQGREAADVATEIAARLG